MELGNERKVSNGGHPVKLEMYERPTSVKSYRQLHGLCARLGGLPSAPWRHSVSGHSKSWLMIAATLRIGDCR